jgi:hypothetical protein
MRRLFTAAALLLLALPAFAAAGPEVAVAEPFLELRTGPGRGYPVTQVVKRGERVTIEKRRTDWFKVVDAGGRSGWAHRSAMLETLGEAGEPLSIDDPGREDFGEHRRELGALAGDFEGANVISVYGAWAVNPHLSAELRVSQILGSFSDGDMATLGLTHVFRPDWRIQPFAGLGTGVINISPKASLVQTEKRTDQVAYAGLGAKAYLSRRFILRAEFNKYVVFTDRDDNEEADEWKLGFAFFF